MSFQLKRLAVTMTKTKAPNGVSTEEVYGVTAEIRHN